MPDFPPTIIGLSRTPDYDSGWLVYGDTEVKELTHNLGTTKVVIQVEIDYGEYGIMLTEGLSMVHAFDMTETTVNVESWMPDGNKIRLMMWKLE